MQRQRIALLTLAALWTGTCSGQSLWNPSRAQPSLVSDTVARNVGDILTIIVSERQRVRNNEQAEFKKEMDLDAALQSFQVRPNAFNPLPDVKGFSNRNMKGDARYNKDGSFETRVAAVVLDVLPNGNLIVEGRRRVVMDKETKTMRLTGIVRPFDITTTNTVMSEDVANASVAYEGKGPLTDITNRGWLSGLLDAIWPF